MPLPEPPPPDPRMASFVKRWAKPDPPPRNGTPIDVAAPGSAPAYAQAAFTAELATLGAAPEGKRNATLNVSGFNLAQLVGAGHLPRQETWDALFDTALGTGLEDKEVHGTLTSAFRAGEATPRDVPKQHVYEDATIFVPPPSVDGSDGEPEGIAAQLPILNWQELWDDERKDDWIVDGLIPARRLIALFSPPKVGKSLLMLELAVGIARGEKVMGLAHDDDAHRVLYVDFENDPRGDIRTRLQDMGRKPSELLDLCYMSFPRLPYLDTAMGALVLVQAVEHYACDVVVIDTISRIVQGEENDNDTWLSFYRHTGVALKSRGVTVIRLDHTGKDETKGMRGGSAKYGDVDVVWSLSRVSEDQLQLECTANRLPVPGKLLLVTRRTEPYLTHEVERSTTGKVFDARAVECSRVLEEQGCNAATTQYAAEQMLNKAGRFPQGRTGNAHLFTRAEVGRALACLTDRDSTTVVDDLRTRAFKDD
jgi:hypothetical protein